MDALSCFPMSSKTAILGLTRALAEGLGRDQFQFDSLALLKHPIFAIKEHLKQPKLSDSADLHGIVSVRTRDGVR